MNLISAANSFDKGGYLYDKPLEVSYEGYIDQPSSVSRRDEKSGSLDRYCAGLLMCVDTYAIQLKPVSKLPSLSS